jgi:pimeloyl-ACP methyl ester carboxylesterase
MHGARISRLVSSFPLLLGAAAGLPGCDPDDKKQDEKPGVFEAEFTANACPFAAPDGLKVTCGTLTTLENYAKPQGELVELAVARFASTSAAPAKDPIVYLSGGPGGAGIEEVRALFDSFEPMLRERDVIAIDQRGTGQSKPLLGCHEVSAAETDEQGFAALATCKKRMTDAGIDLSQYNTANNARDLQELRKALGLKSWNAMGTSYGTRLVLELMRLDEAGLRAVVLDSTAPPDVDNLSETLPAFQRSLHIVLEACAQDAACNQDFPDLEERFYRLAAELNQTPFVAELEGETVSLDGNELVSTVHSMLYSTSEAQNIPSLIVALEQRLPETLYGFLAGGAPDASSEESFSTGMYLSVICAEWAPMATAENLAAAKSAVRPEVATGLDVDALLKVCEAWDVPSAPKSQYEPVQSDLPTLILAGDIDPATPPSWGERAKRTLPNAHFSLFKSESHGVFTGACGAEFVAEFLSAPMSVVDPTCEERTAPFSIDPFGFAFEKRKSSTPSATPGLAKPPAFRF